MVNRLKQGAKGLLCFANFLFGLKRATSFGAATSTLCRHFAAKLIYELLRFSIKLSGVAVQIPFHIVIGSGCSPNPTFSTSFIAHCDPIKHFCK